MVTKVFLSYRRDDVPGDARSIRDSLAAKLGRSSVFMDVDNLLVGQRFDQQLARALEQCTALLVVIGPRWLDLLNARLSEHDYVQAEIVAALDRQIPVIPVRVGRQDSMPRMPRADELPERIRPFILHQKIDISHEKFGRDVSDLTKAVVALERSKKTRGRLLTFASIGAAVAAAVVVSVLALEHVPSTYQKTTASVSTPRLPPSSNSKPAPEISAEAVAERQRRDEEAKVRLAELKRQWAAEAPQQKAEQAAEYTPSEEPVKQFQRARPKKQYNDGVYVVSEGIGVSVNGRIKDENFGSGQDIDLKVCKEVCQKDNLCSAFSWLPPRDYFLYGVCNAYYDKSFDTVSLKSGIVGIKKYP